MPLHKTESLWTVKNTRKKEEENRVKFLPQRNNIYRTGVNSIGKQLTFCKNCKLFSNAAFGTVRTVCEIYVVKSQEFLACQKNKE